MATQLPDNISLAGLNVTRSQEGRALRAYQDAVHVWTIGYGLTNYDKGLPWKIGPGLVITEDEAEWYLYKSIRDNYLPDVLRALAGGTYQYPQGAVDGGVDFHFNTGGILRAAWPRLLGAGKLAAAKSSLESWNKAGGRVLSDLVRRRAINWAEVSAQQYGHLSGPLNIVPTATGRESYQGHGDLLAAYPTDPALKGEPPSAPRTITTPPARPAPGALKKGMNGPDVTAAQIKLNQVGAGIPVTGIYDDATAAAVTKFQASHPHLTADGVIGPATDASLSREINLRNAAAKASKAALPSIPAAWGAFHRFVSVHAGQIALSIGIAIALSVIAYLAWRYRNDISSITNRWRGKAIV